MRGRSDDKIPVVTDNATTAFDDRLNRVAVAFILGTTAWGRHVYAVGDDKEAARLAGIPVNRVLMSVYLAAGAVLAIGAWIQIGRTNAASPSAPLRKSTGFVATMTLTAPVGPITTLPSAHG